MFQVHDRRVFLRSLAAGVGAGFMPAVFSHGRLFAGDDQTARIRFAICNELFRDWPFDKMCKFVADCGYEGLEIAPFTLAQYVTQLSKKQRAQLRKTAEQSGLRIVALHWLLAKTEGLHLTSPDPQVRKHTAEYLAALAECCADLGGDILVFGSPKQRDVLPGVTKRQALRYAVEVIRQALPALEKHEVILALEPLSPKETNFMTTAAEAMEVIRRVDSPYCRLHLDCKAMYSEPTPIPELIRRYAKWMVHFHANDPNLQGPGFGDLDFVPIFEALVDVGYKGWVSVEVFDYSPGPEKLARDSIRYMRRCLQQVLSARARS